MPRTIRTAGDEGADREIDYLHQRIDDLTAATGNSKAVAGKKGATGPQGLPGQDGADGLDGAIGPQGLPLFLLADADESSFIPIFGPAPASSAGASANQAIGNISGVFDGGGIALVVGTKVRVRCDFAGTITAATVLIDQTDILVIEVRKCTYAQYDAGATHPATGDKISASAPPTVTSAVKSTDSALTGWTKTVSTGDIFEFCLLSLTNATWCYIQLDVTKS